MIFGPVKRPKCWNGERARAHHDNSHVLYLCSQSVKEYLWFKSLEEGSAGGMTTNTENGIAWTLTVFLLDFGKPLCDSVVIRDLIVLPSSKKIIFELFNFGSNRQVTRRR